MFCPKCGIELAPDAAFCPACGAKIEAPAAEAAAPQKEEVAAKPAPKAAAPRKIELTLTTAELVSWGVALLSFMLMLMPNWKISTWGTSQTYSVLINNIFQAQALLGLAKVLTIINIFVFALCFITRFVDADKCIKASFSIKKILPFVFYGIQALNILFVFIGSLIMSAGRPACCWYLGLLTCACGILLTIKPDLLDKMFKK